MASKIAWVDFAEKDRQQMLDFVRLFRSQEARDELGMGTVRDAFSDYFFPGTSTIQTRARYMLLIPWIYLNLEQKRVSSEKIAGRARNDEYKLIEALMKSDDLDGIIGKEAGNKLQRLPSNVYWAGLGSWGIRLFPGSQDQYHRNLDNFYRKPGRIIADDKEILESGGRENWDPGIPEPPSDLLEYASIKLTQEEARYLQDKIVLRHRNSLLAILIEEKTLLKDDYPWLHSFQKPLPVTLSEELEYARNFSESVYGASLLYNLMLAEMFPDDERTTFYKNELQLWAQNIKSRWQILSTWHEQLSVFWQCRPLANYGVPGKTQTFISSWLAYLYSRGPDEIVNMQAVRELILNREYQLKKNRARLYNQDALQRWQGAAGTVQLEYRWPTVKVIVNDIIKGLTLGSDNNA